jgi:hypothetical protein
MFIRDTVVAIVVGMGLLLLLSRLIGRIQFSLRTAFWCSFIGHIFIVIVGAITGFLFAYHLAIGLLIALAIGWAFQTVLFQIAVPAKCGTLQQWRAAILSAVIILGDFFVASPLAGLLCSFNQAQQTNAGRTEFEQYKTKADQGAVDAQYMLGVCYYKGEGVAKGQTEGVKWFRKAAEQGNADAQYMLGRCYNEGTGVKRNYAEAVKWWRKAAEQERVLLPQRHRNGEELHGSDEMVSQGCRSGCRRCPVYARSLLRLR